MAGFLGGANRQPETMFGEVKMGVQTGRCVAKRHILRGL